MRTRPFYLIVVFLASLMAPCLAENPVLSTTTKTSPAITTPPEQQEDTEQPEGEATGIIPPGADMTVSTQPVTPVTIFPEKKPYEEAQYELGQAQDLFKKADMEAASDTALEAYDDLMNIHMPRRKHDKMRVQLRNQRYQAASIYIQAGIAFIDGFVKRTGNTPETVEEAKSRLEDLRDVARDYDDLRSLLNKAIEELSATKHP